MYAMIIGSSTHSFSYPSTFPILAPKPFILFLVFTLVCFLYFYFLADQATTLMTLCLIEDIHLINIIHNAQFTQGKVIISSPHIKTTGNEGTHSFFPFSDFLPLYIFQFVSLQLFFLFFFLICFFSFWFLVLFPFTYIHPCTHI